MLAWELSGNRVTGHVNNVVYNRYAESARINWALNFANIHDPAHKTEWAELVGPTGIGMILRSIRTDYKFVWPPRQNITIRKTEARLTQAQSQ